MQFLSQILDLFLNLDKYLGNIISQYGSLTYGILFLILFAETGLVVTPFLPGDSLLFVAGTLAGAGHLNIFSLYSILLSATIIGDNTNYWIGHFIGTKAFAKKNSRIFKKEYLEKTREFYEKYGVKTIILARFFPIIRTFAPFVAGVGKMHYKTFFLYSVAGGFLWISIFTFAGYFFGGLEIVQKNFHYAVIGIIFLSLVPMILEIIKYKGKPSLTKKQLEHATYTDIKSTFKKEHLND